MLVRVDNGTDPAVRTHRCEFCGRLYDCRACGIHMTTSGFTLKTHPDCEKEYRCPECPKPQKAILTDEERMRLDRELFL